MLLMAKCVRTEGELWENIGGDKSRDLGEEANTKLDYRRSNGF